MLEAKNVVKTFDGFRALDGATLTAPAGVVYGLVGPNGAGKSTLIRHLTGVYRPDSGELLLGGEPVYENPAASGAWPPSPMTGTTFHSRASARWRAFTRDCTRRSVGSGTISSARRSRCPKSRYCAA